MHVTVTDDPAAALTAAGDFLRSKPVEHNLVLSLVLDRIKKSEPGRYVWAASGNEVCGVLLQSPTNFTATLTPMPRKAIESVVESLDGVELPGVNGDAPTTSSFAGAWAERRKERVVPAEGMRLYALAELIPPKPASGSMRLISDEDFPVIVKWMRAFADETEAPLPSGKSDEEAARYVVETRRLWMWEDAGARVCLVGAVPGAENVSRIGPVYTPPDHRQQGFAAACTAAVTQILLDEGQQPILYTQLANPTSNSVYRKLGFEPVSEILRYSFGGGLR